MFDDVLDANRRYQTEFHDSGVPGTAAKGLAVLTCIDSRIDPLAMLGLRAGDAKIIRNAGARVTDDALRSLVLGVHLLGVNRVAVIGHTRCKMAEASDAELRTEITERAGVPADDWDFRAVGDQLATLRSDLATIRACPLVPGAVELGGFVYDVDTGRLRLEASA